MRIAVSTSSCSRLSPKQKVTGLLIAMMTAFAAIQYAVSNQAFDTVLTNRKGDGSWDNSGTIVSREQVLRWNDSLLLSCPGYREFRATDLTHPRVAETVCAGGRAFRRVGGKYEPCVLRRPFNPYFLRQALEASKRTYFHGLNGEKLPAFVLALGDSISNLISNSHEWEMPLVKKLAAIVKTFPNTAFMDIGANLGTYTLPMAAHGLTTISMDANFRVIIRVLLSLMANGIEPKQSQLLWNIVSKNDTQLEYLTFPGVCDTGTGAKTQPGLKDTIPVIPIASQRLAPLIGTKNVVLKIDVEGSEAGFFLTSGSLFKDFNFIAVQMEWRADLLGAADMRDIVGFFSNRNYVPLKGYSWTELATDNYSVWDKRHDNSFEVLWVRREYKQRVIDATF